MKNPGKREWRTAAAALCFLSATILLWLLRKHDYRCDVIDTDNQRVIINMKDVNDEPPYFINRPLPMQTVVQLNAPPNTHVFTLQARDPDTDHNIHYFIVRDRST